MNSSSARSAEPPTERRCILFRAGRTEGLVKALLLGALLAVAASTPAAAQDAAAVVADVTRAMGVTGLKAITFALMFAPAIWLMKWRRKRIRQRQTAEGFAIVQRG